MNGIPLSTMPEIEPDFYNYEKNLIQGQLNSIQEKIIDLQNFNPEFKNVSMQKLRDNLISIEADTYADLILSGELNENLSPMVQEIIAKQKGE